MNTKPTTIPLTRSARRLEHTRGASVWAGVGLYLRTAATVVGVGLTLGMMGAATARADTFGSGPNTFTLDFVEVGNAGNADDYGLGGGLNFSPDTSPYGGVGYDYRISKYEISQNNVDTARSAGLQHVTAGPHTGDQPAAKITWHEAAAFVNWLNTIQGHHETYDLSRSGGDWTMHLWSPGEQATTGVASGTNAYRHKDAYYVLPSEDEWYKAGYHKNDGVTANYWDFAVGSNTIRNKTVASGTDAGTVVLDQDFEQGPAAVDQAGGQSPYGTVGQNGNVFEWLESASDGTNNDASEVRTVRGGDWYFSLSNPYSALRQDHPPDYDISYIGYRVAAVPEPGTMVLLGLGGVWMIGPWRRRRRGLQA